MRYLQQAYYTLSLSPALFEMPGMWKGVSKSSYTLSSHLFQKLECWKLSAQVRYLGPESLTLESLGVTCQVGKWHASRRSGECVCRCTMPS